MTDIVTINGVAYAPIANRPTGTRAVVVVDRGWIFAGGVTRSMRSATDVKPHAFQADISKIYAALAEGQQDFGSEFTAIWDANLDALYEA